MMDVDISSIVDQYKIIVFDEDKTRSTPGLLYTTTTEYNFNNKKEMFDKWQEIIRGDHMDAQLIATQTQVAFAHRLRRR